jgi:uncharacterized protein YciI
MSETKQYLYRIRPTRFEMLVSGPTTEESERVSQHFAYLQRLSEQGVVILAGRTLTADEEGMGIVIFNANSDEEAQAIMSNDPAVHYGVMSAKLFPYRVALIREANVR